MKKTKVNFIEAIPFTIVKDGVELEEKIANGRLYEVLKAPYTLSVDWLLRNSEHDDADYLRHCGGVSLDYKGFIIQSAGEHIARFDGERFCKRPELILGYRNDRERLSFEKKGYIEIVNQKDENSGQFGSVAEAVRKIHSIVNDDIKLVDRVVDGVNHTVLETADGLTINWLLAHPEHNEANYLKTLWWD